MKWLPDRKVWAGGLNAVIAFLIVSALQRYTGVVIPADMQTMIAVGVGTATSYLVPPSAKDIVKRLNDGLVAMAQADPGVPVTGIPPAKITSTIVRMVPLLFACTLALSLAACSSVPKAGALSGPEMQAVIGQALDEAKALTPEQKWMLACNGATATLAIYEGFIAPKQKAAVNAKVRATFAAVEPFCINRPENYATALISLMQAIAAFNASLPAKMPVAT